MPKKGVKLMARRGIGRSVTKKPSSSLFRYTRNKVKDTKFSKWKLDQRFIITAGKYELARRLFSIGWLQCVRTCPHCGCKVVGKLHDRLRVAQGKGGRDVQGRCPSWQCHKSISIYAGSSLWKQGHGACDLREQALLLHGFLTGSSRTQLMRQFGITKIMCDTHLRHFRTHISNWVQSQQESMDFKKMPPWTDVEADEVTLAKRPARGGRLQWASYLGMVGS